MVLKKNTNLIKAANEALVIDVLRKVQQVSVEDIIYMTRLSRQTVLNIIGKLLEKDIIEKSGFKSQTVGRRPILYSLSRLSYFAIGIDVDVRPIYLDISRLDGTLYYSNKWEVASDASADQIIDSIIENIKFALEKTRISEERIIGLGLGLPAIVNLANNTAERISRIKGWKRELHAGIADIIERVFGFKTYVRNDSHLLSLLEISPENQDFLYVLHRSGIGLSPVIEGAIFEGKFGNSGYIGHARIGFNGNACDCGSKDCLETYCSKRKIEHEYEKRTGVFCTYDTLIKQAEYGDQNAVEVFEMAGFYLGTGIANTIKNFDIPKVILGDLRCSEQHVFFKSIVKSIEENLNNFSVSSTEIKLASKSGEHYGLGGCHYVLDQFFSEPKLITSFSNLRGDMIEQTI